MEKNSKKRITADLLIVALMIAGLLIMIIRKASADDLLSSQGIENLRYYTVLSNLFCGITALADLLLILLKKDTERLLPFKLAAVSAVTVTFSVVAFFFAPIYGISHLYKGANFIFHLVEPVVAIAGFLIVRKSHIPFRYCVYAAIPTIIYGSCYLGNLLINGIGKWPDTNDFYGFVNWGYPIGIAIFMGITLFSFLTACLLRWLTNKIDRLHKI